MENAINKDKKRRKLYVFSICLMSALFIWLLIKLSSVYIVNIRKDISFVNKDPKFEFAEKPHSSVKLIVKATGFKLIKEFLKSNQPIIIDLESINPKMQGHNSEIIENIQISEYAKSINLQLSTGITFIKSEPEIISIAFDKKARKLVKINPAYNITTERQFMIKDIIIEPEYAVIEGAEKIIKQIEMLTNDSLIVDKCKKSFVQKRLLKVNNSNNMIKIMPDSVTIKCSVEEYTEYSLEVLIKAVKYKNRFKIKTFPDKAILKFRVPLNKYKDINKEMFEIIPDTNEISKDHILIKLSEKPDFIKNVKIVPESTEYLLISE